MAETPRLLVDSMLGSLAKWLRLLGYDTAYVNGATDHEMARRSRAEGRVLITRDRGLASRRGLRTLLIRTETTDEQVREVIATLPIDRTTVAARCSSCNGLLHAVLAADVAAEVPPYVLQTQSGFLRCSACGRVYWEGTHRQSIQDRLDSFQSID